MEVRGQADHMEEGEGILNPRDCTRETLHLSRKEAFSVTIEVRDISALKWYR